MFFDYNEIKLGTNSRILKTTNIWKQNIWKKNKIFGKKQNIWKKTQIFGNKITHLQITHGPKKKPMKIRKYFELNEYGSTTYQSL